MATNSELRPGLNLICIHSRRTPFLFQSRHSLPGKFFRTHTRKFVRRRSISQGHSAHCEWDRCRGCDAQTQSQCETSKAW
jgi:hypothetical protein